MVITFDDGIIRLVVFVLELSLTFGLIQWMRKSLWERPEHFGYFASLIGYGALAALICAFVELNYSINLNHIQQINPDLVTTYGLWYRIINNLAASSIEELAKYVAAVFTILNTKHIHKLSDAIVYFIIIGLGFSLMEDILFLLNPEVIAPYRLFSFYIHSGTGAIVGYTMGRYLSGAARHRQLVWAICGAILLHFAYNTITDLELSSSTVLLTILVTTYISLQIFILFHKAVLEEYRLGHRFKGETTQRLLNL